jgi:Flp pilus assembly protein TadG
MKRFWSRFWRKEQGGIHILGTSLLAIVFIVGISAAAINWGLHTLSVNKVKLALDQSVRAAALSIDQVEAAAGFLVLDESQAALDFHRYLRLNLRLNESDLPAVSSLVADKPVVHVLEFVRAPVYPVTVQRSVTLYPGATDQTIRTIDVTLYGPSVLSITEFRIRRLGSSRLTPLVISSVASVRFR